MLDVVAGEVLHFRPKLAKHIVHCFNFLAGLELDIIVHKSVKLLNCI